MSIEDVKPQGQPSLRPGLTKRQTEVLERLEQGYPVKRIATDMGVTRNAVYQTIERLRRAGAVPETYTPSGQAAEGSSAGELPVGSAIALGSALAPRESRLPDLRELPADARDGAAYAELIEAAIARADVPALAYELGRADSSGAEDLPKQLAEAALRRLGVLADGDSQHSHPAS
jgi:DNA-binding CsgD family transcriptional regulator